MWRNGNSRHRAFLIFFNFIIQQQNESMQKEKEKKRSNYLNVVGKE